MTFDLKKLITLSLASTLLLTSCSTILRPTKFYLYSSGTLNRPDQNDRTEFEKVKKTSRFRQAGHITYDYFKVPAQLTFPNDSILFKSLVKEILYARVKDMHVDSIVVDSYIYRKENEVDIGTQEYVEASGRIYLNSGKSCQSRFRRFGASYLPKQKNNIINIGTYNHLKF